METFSALLAICAGNSPVSGEFPAQRPVTRSFDVFFDVRLIKRLSKHSRGWWFETLSHPLWRHRNVNNYFLTTYNLLPFFNRPIYGQIGRYHSCNVKVISQKLLYLWMKMTKLNKCLQFYILALHFRYTRRVYTYGNWLHSKRLHGKGNLSSIRGNGYDGMQVSMSVPSWPYLYLDYLSTERKELHFVTVAQYHDQQQLRELWVGRIASQAT